MLLKIEKDKLGASAQAFEAVAQDVNVAAARTGAVNSKFAVDNNGAWADGSAQASLLIENNLHIYFEALKSFSTDFTAAFEEADGSLSAARDAVPKAVGSSVDDANIVKLDDSYAVDTSATMASDSCLDLYNACETARVLLSNVDDSLSGAGGRAQSHLGDLKMALVDQQSKMDDLAVQFPLFKTAAQNWEDDYSSRFSSTEFVTDKMIASAQGAMKASYSQSLTGRTAEFLGAIKGKSLVDAPVISGFTTPGLKGIKTWLSFLGSGAADMGLGAVELYMPKWAGELAQKAGVTLPSFMKEGKYLSRLSDKALESFGLLNPSQWEKAWGQLTQGVAAGKSAEDIVKRFGSLTADAADDALPFAQKIANAGTKLKAAGRVVGWVGDAIDLFNIGASGHEAYMTTTGDEASKEAAATMAVAGGLTKFAAGKAAGFLIGAAIGGPVGAVAGMVVGEAASWAIGKLAKWEPVKNFTSSVQNGLASLFRGGRQSAFA